MLNVVKPIVAACYAPALADPALGAGLGRVDADVHDFRQLDTPFADDAKALVIPFGIGDQIDQNVDPKRAGEFQCLEIAAESDPLAESLQRFFIDRFDAEKQVFEAKLLPETKDILVPQQHIAAGFKVILLLDARAGDRLTDRHRVPLLQKGDIVDDEDPGLAYRSQIFDRPLRADQPIASAVKRPGAAEGTIPRTAARKLDRGAGIERAEKIFAAMAQQIARRCQIIERVDEAGRRSLSVRRHRSRHGYRVMAALDRGQEHRHACLAFSFQHAVDGARAMLDDRGGGERGAMAPDADEYLRETDFRSFGEIDDLGNVRQIVARESDNVRPPAFEHSELRARVLDL